MLAACEVPMRDTPPPARLRPLFCKRCGEGTRPLCEVKPGEVWILHRDGYRVISGITPGAVMWARCGKCGLHQPVELPHD